MTDDEQRFEALWAAHSRAVLRYAARRVPSGDVDDVVAETFVVAWRRLAQVPDPALPWLLGVARGVVSNTARSADRRTALHLRLAETGQTPAGTWADARLGAGSAVMADALQRLSAADRELLTLIAWDGLTSAEAASALGCSRATLAVRLHRARSRLRGHLEAATTAAAHRDPELIDTIDSVGMPLPGSHREEPR